MKLIIISLVLLGLLAGKSFGVVLLSVESPRDDVQVVGACKFLCDHPELQAQTDEYNELLQVRLWPLKMKDMAAVFGPALNQKPDDRVKPLFVSSMIMESGLGYGDAANKRHVDYHTIGDIGFLEVHYQYDGVSVGTAVIYLKADDEFVPVLSTNDIARREAWERPRYEKLKAWLGEHLPKLNDLGVVAVSPAHPTRLDLGAGAACVLTTRDIHCDTVPYWLSIGITREISKDYMTGADFMASKDLMDKFVCDASLDRVDKPVGFGLDGKFYRMVPKLVDASGGGKR
jgi:hypothetical protein